MNSGSLTKDVQVPDSWYIWETGPEGADLGQSPSTSMAELRPGLSPAAGQGRD